MNSPKALHPQVFLLQTHHHHKPATCASFLRIDLKVIDTVRSYPSVSQTAHEIISALSGATVITTPQDCINLVKVQCLRLAKCASWVAGFHLCYLVVGSARRPEGHFVRHPISHVVVLVLLVLVLVSISS